MNKVLIALICMAAPVTGIASDYDDDSTIDITDEEWEDPGTDVDIDFSDDSSGIDGVSAGGQLPNGWIASCSGKEFRVSVSGNDVQVNASNEAIIPVYRIETSSVRMVRVDKGDNTFTLESGLYVILGRKLRL